MTKKQKNFRLRVGQGFIGLGVLLIVFGFVVIVDCGFLKVICSPPGGHTTSVGAGLGHFFLFLFIALGAMLSLLVGGVLLLLEKQKAAAPPGTDSNASAVVSIGLGVAAMLITWFLAFINTGLVDLFTCAFMFLLPLATIAIGVVAKVKAAKPGGTLRMQANTGLVSGALALLLALYFTVPSLQKEVTLWKETKLALKETKTFVLQVEELGTHFEKPDPDLYSGPDNWIETWQPSIMFMVDKGGAEVKAECEKIRWPDRCFCLHKETGEGGADTMKCVLCDNEAVAQCDAWMEYPRLTNYKTLKLSFEPSSAAVARLKQLQREGARFQVEMDVRGNRKVNAVPLPSARVKRLLVNGRPIRDLLRE